MTVLPEMNVPADLVEQLRELTPRLAEQGVQRLDVFSYGRPGEPSYWLAFLITAAGRQTMGTPDLRHLPLPEQVPEFLRQLESWTP